MEIIRRGAEAEILLGAYMGKRVVVKSRKAKEYRHPQLDSELRSSRTRNEARLLQEARKLGVPTPIIYDIDTQKAEIVMQYVEGERAKDALAVSSRPEARSICRKIGRMAALLHRGGVVHGDLTTSNMIIAKSTIWLIDFSLGTRAATIEEMGVDIHLLSEAFASAHSDILDLFQDVLSAYADHFDDADQVLKKVKEIEERGRYT